MATSDFTSALLGPHFAPVDPTLPKPWIGLIDGSTGLLYYWNPGTNITQYERPADPAIAPPLPPGPPPSAALKITPIPVAGTLNPDVIQQQPGPQILQQPSQQMPQLLDQQHQKLPPSQQLPFQQPNQHQQMSQQQPQLISYPLTQDGKQQFHQPNQRFSQQLQQMQYPQVSYLQGQLMLCMQGQQLEGLQMSHQHGRKLQEPQMLQLQGQHLKGPQIHQLGQQPQWSQISHQQGQQPVGIRQQGKQPQGLEITNQEGQQVQWQQSHTQRLGHLQGQQGGFPRAEVAGLQERIEAGPTSPLVHQTGMISSTHYFPGGSPQVSHPLNPPQQLGGLFSVSMQQAGCAQVQLQQEGLDTIYIQQQTGAPMAPNVMEHATCRPPVGLRMGSEEDWHRRAGNDVYVSRGNDGSMLPPEQPKFAPLPLVMNWQDIRMGSINSQFSSQGHAMPDSYNHAPLPHAGPMGPPLRMMRSPQFPRMSAADAYRQHHEVTTMGDNVPAPFMTFEATGFPPDILREMHFAGFSTPTPIQAQTWPVALQNRDVVAIAKTGSGKTLAYLIPAIIRLRQCRNNPQNGPKVMILAPTRYHVTQVQEEALKFGHSSRISCTCLYSGAPKGSQLQELERGVDIVVATPRQLNDIHEMRKINFCQVSMLVLDEADQMLDMGFQPQIRRIVNAIPHRRQTLMYTATWPKEVRKMAGDLLANAVQITVGSVDELAANKSITQFVEVITEMDKERRLEQIIRAQEFGSKIIIFCSTKKLCDQLAGSIGRTFGAVAIHGDESQDEKDHVLNEFHAGRARVLVATDVAARGLYIKHIGAVVINYDFPSEIEDYVHQIGQTGMAGATGVSYTFFSDRNWKYATDLIKVLEGANQHVPPEVREMAAHGGPVYPGGGEHGGISHWDSEGGGWDSGGARGMMRNGEGRRGITMDDRGRRGMMSYGTGGNFDGRDGGSVEFYGGHGGTTRGFGGSIGAGGRGGQHRGPSNRFNHLLRGYDRSRSRSRSHSCSRSWSPSRSRSQSRSRSPNHDYDRFARPCKRVSGFDAPLAAPTQQAPPAASGVGVLLAPPLGPRYEAPTMSVFDVCQMSPMSPGPANGSFITVNESPDKRIWPGGLPNTGMDPGFTHVLYLWNKMGGCKHSRVTSKKVLGVLCGS